MATFALNSRKWKHEDGGDLNGNNSNNIYDNNNGDFEPVDDGDCPF